MLNLDMVAATATETFTTTKAVIVERLARQALERPNHHVMAQAFPSSPITRRSQAIYPRSLLLARLFM